MKDISPKAFSIIEILIGIFIFSMGLVSVYSLISSILNLNDYNENYIIASYLSHEQNEQIRNMRDTNYARIQKYNQIDPFSSDYESLISTGSYYRVSHNYDQPNSDYSMVLEQITPFVEGKDQISNMEIYRVCKNDKGLYLYCLDSSGIQKPGLKNTYFYKYVYVDKVQKNIKGAGNTELQDALLLRSKVIWNFKGYHEIEIKTILSDWKVL